MWPTIDTPPIEGPKWLSKQKGKTQNEKGIFFY